MDAKEHGKNNFAISSANHPTECDGYFGFAEVIFPVFLRALRAFLQVDTVFLVYPIKSGVREMNQNFFS